LAQRRWIPRAEENPLMPLTFSIVGPPSRAIVMQRVTEVMKHITVFKGA
jgi:hypothetical protein